MSAFDPTALEQHFATLCELDPQARGIALRELAVKAPELARRLAALLDAHVRGADFAEQIGRDARATLGLIEPADLIGRELGGYRLTELLGRGGMGIVFGAEREFQGVRQRAAVKLLSLPLFDVAASDRFLREAATLARLEHPGICRLRDFGRSPEGWPFLVLDWIDGQPLHRYSESCPVRRRIALVSRVADAVATAHRQLVVHLDIKPENVLVTTAGDPVLLDFGIARVLDDSGDASATVTLARWLTPDYAAPERLRGEPSTVAADLYSLGALLYRVCCGVPPFDLAGRSVTDALHTVERGAVPPSRRMAGLPRDLDAIVAKAMHSDPARRYPGADAFAADLRALLADQPVSARPDSVGYRFHKLAQRHPVALPASAGAVALLAILATAMVFQTIDLSRQRDRAEREALRARSATELLLGSIKAADPSGETGGAVDLNSLMEATSRRIRLELVDEPELLAEGLVGIGAVRAATGQHELALAAFEEAIALLDRGGDDPADALPAHLGKIDALRWLDRLDEGIAYGKALAPRLAPELRWEVDAAIGLLQVVAGELDAAEESLGAALRDMPEAGFRRRSDLFNSLGSLHNVRGQHDQALAWYERALAAATSAAGGLDREATVRNNRARLFGIAGRKDEALAEIERALGIRRRLYGDAHHLTLESRGFQVSVLTELARYDEAIDAARAAIDAEAGLPGGGGTLLAGQLHGHLGMALHRSERLDEATIALERAVEIMRRHLPDDHATIASARNNLASVLSLRGEHRAASEQFLKVWDVYKALSPDTPTTFQAIIASNLAECYAYLGEAEPGLAWSARALDAAAKVLPPQHWIVGHMRTIRARNLMLDGQMQAAESEALAAERIISQSQTPAQPKIVRDNLALLASIYDALGDEARAEDFRARAAPPGKTAPVATTASGAA